MRDFITHVGMDTDKKGYDIAIAEGFGSDNQEVRSWGRIPATPDSLKKLVRQLRAKGHTRLRFSYEAGPCGYSLYRQLKALGVECAVIAPSMIPVKPGERVKTNRRDAIKLARLDRAGELTEVNVPDEGDEAMRDLVRGRGASVEAATRIKLQIKGLLLRNGLTYTGTGERWSWQYRIWLKTIKFEHPAQNFVLQEWLVALAEAETRVERLTEQIKELLPEWRMHEVVKALQSLRGVALLSAVGVVAEVGDMTRFKNPRELMAYLGLVPSEHSTGEKRRLGSITKSGNIRARQTLVESAWAYSKRPQLTRALQARQKGLAGEVIQISWKAQVRLCSRYKKLTSRGKSTRKAVVAVARELCAFMWAIAKAVETNKPQQAV
jgi:transposase